MNKIAEMIKNKETEVFKFRPNPNFYRKVQINQKRWGLIYRGKKEPTISELRRIAEYFDVSIHKLIDKEKT